MTLKKIQIASSITRDSCPVTYHLFPEQARTKRELPVPRIAGREGPSTVQHQYNRGGACGAATEACAATQAGLSNPATLAVLALLRIIAR